MAHLADPSGGETAPRQVLGQYRLVAELARGGMGIVYLGVLRGPAGFSKLFAIKVLKPELTEDDALLAMFLDEARLAARLEHANITRTVEADADAGHVFMVMEYLEGQTMHRLLARYRSRGGLSLAAQVHIISKTLDGLHYAHELRDASGTPLRIVHRDVTPHNIFVTYNGHVKVMDFGIAKAIGQSHETRTGVLKGKVGYMAPEQVNGEPVDHRADLFSVGIVLWESITGRRIWHDKTDLEILHKLANEDIPDPRSIAPDAPEALCLICDRALSPHASDRYASAADMRNDLDAYLDSLPERVTPAALSTLVLTPFATERARVNGLVNDYLAKLREAELNDVPDDGPTLVMPNAFPMDTVEKPSALGGTYAGVAPADPRTLSLPSRSTMPMFAWFAAALVASALALAAYTYSRARNVNAVVPDTVTTYVPPTATSTLTPTSDTTPPPHPLPLIEISIRAVPSTATFTLDNIPLVGNPYKGELARDGATHRLRATADGYIPKTLDVAFDDNLVLDFALERPRSTGGAMHTPRRAAPPVPPAKSTAVLPTPNTPNRRPIDATTPYRGR